MIYDWFGQCNGYGYPYTDFHRINLDYILCTLKKLIAELQALDERVTILERLLERLTERVTSLEERMTQAEADIADIRNKYVKKSGDSMAGTLNMTNNFIQNVKYPISDGDAANKKYVDDMIKTAKMLVVANYADIQTHSADYTDNQIIYCQGAYTLDDGGQGFFQIRKETENHWIQWPNIKITNNPPEIGEAAVAVRLGVEQGIFPLAWFGVAEGHDQDATNLNAFFEFLQLYIPHAEIVPNKDNDNTLKLTDLSGNVTSTHSITFKAINFITIQFLTTYAVNNLFTSFINCTFDDVNFLIGGDTYTKATNVVIKNCYMQRYASITIKKARSLCIDTVEASSDNSFKIEDLYDTTTITNCQPYPQIELNTPYVTISNSRLKKLTIKMNGGPRLNIFDSIIDEISVTNKIGNSYSIYNSQVILSDNSYYNTTFYNCDITIKGDLIHKQSGGAFFKNCFVKIEKSNDITLQTNFKNCSFNLSQFNHKLTIDSILTSDGGYADVFCSCDDCNFWLKEVANGAQYIPFASHNNGCYINSTFTCTKIPNGTKLNKLFDDVTLPNVASCVFQSDMADSLPTNQGNVSVVRFAAP